MRDSSTRFLIGLAVALMILTSGFWLYNLLQGGNWTPTAAWLTTWAPWATIPLFLAGVIATRRMPLAPPRGHRVAALLIGIALLALSAAVAFRSSLDLLPLVIGTGLAFFFVLSTAKRAPRPLVALGSVSYEMYFTHFVVLAVLERTPVLSMFQRNWSFLLFMPTVLLLAYASALLVRAGISRPGRRLVDQVFGVSH